MSTPRVCPVCFTLRLVDGSCLCGAIGTTGPTLAPEMTSATRVVVVSSTMLAAPVFAPSIPLPENAGTWHRRYEWHLESIPELLSLSLAGVVPFAATRYGERVDSNGDPRRLPFNAAAMDDADLLWAMLVLYADDVVYRVGGTGPSQLRESAWKVRDEAQGLRAGKAPENAAQDAAEIVAWLVRHCEIIGQTEDLHDAEEPLFDLIRTLRHRYDVAETIKTSRARVCAVCNTRAVVAAYANVAGKESSLVRCANCHAEGKEAIGDEDEDAHLLASGEASSEAPRDDQAVEA